MKLLKTLLFAYALMLLLAIVAIIFPKEGLQIGSSRLEFPALDEALDMGANTAVVKESLTPEELLPQIGDPMVMVQDSSFLDFCQNSPIRISMPYKHVTVADTLSAADFAIVGDSLRNLSDSINMRVHKGDTTWIAYHDEISDDRQMDYLDEFFAALDSASVRHIRIVHYGDSQIEEDRITSGLREHFQAQFGGGGCGMMPAQKWIYKMTCSQSTSPELPYYVAYGSSSMRASHNRYGPMGVVAHADGPTSISFTMSDQKKFAHVHDFNRVTLMRNAPNGKGSFNCVVQEFDSMQNKITLNIKGPADIYGILIDQKTGVSMDNVPMRGCAGNVFTRIYRPTLEPFFKHENVRLIILQYGGNSVPGMRSTEALHIFCRDLQRQVHLFHEIAPQAKILFIGPSDMSTNIDGQKRTYPHLPRLVTLLEKYVTESGAAFWNLFEAMGGEGSMIRWVDARPQLAGEDYVHFTHKGADRVSDLLYETIDTYYKNYKYRQKSGHDK